MGCYNENQKAAGFKVGDEIIITRQAKDFEKGWGTSWSSEMNPCVNKTGIILSIDDRVGMHINFKDYDSGYYERFVFPYFVLDHVKKMPIYLELSIAMRFEDLR